MPVKMLPVEEPKWPSHIAKIGGRGSAAYKASRMCADPRTPITMGVPASIQEIIRQVSRKYEVTPKTILGGAQFYPLPQARAELAHRMRMRGYSLNRIGAIMGKHHTSVYAMVQRFNRSVEAEAEEYVAYDPNSPDDSGIWAI